MKFPMINCLKYSQQCQNGIFKKTCRATRVPYSASYVDLPLIMILCAHIGSIGNPLMTDANKHALRPFYSLNLNIGM